MCWGLNSHWFPVIGDGHHPNSRGVYIDCSVTIPYKSGGMTIPNIEFRPWHIYSLTLCVCLIYPGVREIAGDSLCKSCEKVKNANES